MQPYFITFRSVTYAQRGERALKAGGMDCHLRRTPRWMEAKGCGYALELKDAQRAAALLRDQQISYQKIYRLRGPEQAQEVIL